MTRVRARGFTLIEIMIVVAIIALLAAIAIPNVLRGRTTANESAAIGNLRAVVSSLEMYRSVYQTYPNQDGTAFRDSMYGSDCAVGTNPAPDFGPPSFCKVLNDAQVQSYLYEYDSPVGGPTYTLKAVAANTSSGTRSFFVDESGLIRHCSGTADATANSSTLDQTPVGC